MKITLLAVSLLFAWGVFWVWFENYHMEGITQMPWEGKSCSELKQYSQQEDLIEDLTTHQKWRLDMEAKWWCNIIG